ncbi:disease resistance protein TAO1-like [Rhodamnia argentea]|uniref:Disease resistance protein TAO1-like n=1 Tax=Rhodamnia argentea TaxID=178133 RepID=A0ABM3H476_9MYRT|nr:disease resistance protein TAO1-like [Rhodamnia argentea]
MLHLSFGHSFAELVALILLPGLALYFLNKKKASARRNEEDAGTGAPGSMTTPTEANSDGSTSLPTETNNGACSSPPTSTNSSGSSSSPTETKSGGSSPSPTGISKGASSSSPTETNNSASSSLTTTTGNRYEVFLSFRGPDTRYGFTSHLYKGLHDAGINTFRDDDDNELCQGEDIGPKLTEAITNCQILIPILSVCYGTSSWCLNELAQIIKCKNDNGQMVLPVFYKVKPSDVGHQRGSFGDAFHEREKRLLERPSFDPTILEKWKKALGENKLIYDILKRENEVRDENEGTKFIPSKFKDKKVLLLLDDVDDVGQLKRLAGHPMAGIHDWFSSGSMIIITTRNKRILDEFGVDYAYDHKEMDNDQSLILFSKHAFQRSSPPRDFEELTRAVVSTTGGLPLTLEGTGKIEAIDPSEGSSKGVGKIVERDDNIYTGEQFKNLTSLRFLRMEEGAHLTGDFKDSVEELKWLQWENCPMNFVVNNFHATELVVLELRRGMINDGWEGWSSFKKLKFLDPTHCQYLENTDSLSPFKNLEVLILNNCRRSQQIDSSIGGMKALLRPELRACKSLTKLPEEIGELKALEQLYLQDTSELSALPESIGSLPKLEILNVSQSGIEELPDNIGRLGKLRVLYAIRCFELGGKLPESMGSLQNLEEMAKKLKFLDLGGCRYLKTTAFLSAFKSLEVLNLFGCSRLQQIDSSIGGMKALLRLDLSYRESLTKLPQEIGELKALEQLCLYKTPKLSALPESIGSLQNLEILIISHSGIEELPDGIGRLKKLRQLDASNCKNLKGEMP